MVFVLDFETFLEIYDDDLYIEYMETGCYKDMDREEFDERAYEEYCNREGRWKNISV